MPRPLDGTKFLAKIGYKGTDAASGTALTITLVAEGLEKVTR